MKKQYDHFEKQAAADNAFVKREQEKLKKMMGDRPGAPEEMRKFNAYMSNNEMYAKECAKDLARDMDDAFPVK